MASPHRGARAWSGDDTAAALADGGTVPSLGAAPHAAVRARAGGYAHPAPSTEIVRTELSASGGAVDLRGAYEVCRRLHAAHGRTYYFATRFLPPERRPHVWALYGFARYADDLVDHLDLGWGPPERRRALEAWSAQVLAQLGADGPGGIDASTSPDQASIDPGDDPVLVALRHTVATLGIDHDDLRAFLASMAMDLTVTRYATYEDLAVYVHGSAAVIGTMMLPVLGAVAPAARRPAMDLGVAFQLTNFLRDIAEDWDRGRIYLPLEDLDAFGVTEWDFHARHVHPGFRRLLAFQAARARALYRRAEDGWALLPRASRACIRIAHRLYGGILDAVETEGYQVFGTRAHVRAHRKAAVALGELARPSRPGAGRLP